MAQSINAAQVSGVRAFAVGRIIGLLRSTKQMKVECRGGIAAMIGTGYKSKLACLGVIALASVLAAPADAATGSLGFRNDTDGPVIIQGMSIVRGAIRAGKRHVLQPGDVGWDQIVAPGNKLILIWAAKQPTKVLYQG